MFHAIFDTRLIVRVNVEEIIKNGGQNGGIYDFQETEETFDALLSVSHFVAGEPASFLFSPHHNFF